MVVRSEKRIMFYITFGSWQDGKLKSGFPNPARMDVRNTPCRIGVGVNRW